MELHKNLKLIILSRAFLSFSYGFLNILLSLYLHYLGYSFLFIGGILALAIFINSILALMLGMMADHYGRKNVLILMFILFSISSYLFLFTKDPYVLGLLAGVAGFTGSGGGPIGSGGPFGAIQTAMITEVTERKNFSKTLAFASIIGMGASMGGAFFLTLIETIHISVYSLFTAASVLGLIGTLLVAFITDISPRSKHILPTMSFKNIVKLSIPTLPGGVGNGMVAPILSLWLKVRFDLTPGQIGIVFGFVNLAAIIFMLLTPYYSLKLGELRTIVITRIVGSAFLIAAGLAPIVILASVFLVFRAGMMMGSIPIRQSFAMGTVHESERATTSGATSLSRAGSSSPAPIISGAMMQLSLIFPLVTGGAISMFDPILYYLLFRKSWSQKS